jgi:hypothetical protein
MGPRNENQEMMVVLFMCLIIWGTMAPNAPSIVASNNFSTKGGGVGLQLVYRLAFQLLHM